MTATTTVTTAPATRMKWCKVCQRFTAHVAIGEQPFRDCVLVLYDCSHCGATQSEKAKA
jgi:hypothetical protein